MTGSNQHSGFSRLDAIKAAWIDAEVEDYFLAAQIDMTYLVEQYEGAKQAAGAEAQLANEYHAEMERLQEQKEAADRRDDWLAKQLDGILEDAEALFRAIGSGSGQSGGEAQSARALLANLRDARAALNPASEPYTWEVVNTITTNSESCFTNREDAERRLAELPEGFAVVAFDSRGHAVQNQERDPASEPKEDA